MLKKPTGDGANRSGTAHGYGAFFVKEASRHFCRPLSFHSFVRPAPQAFFRPDRIFESPSRAAAVKVVPITVIAMSRKDRPDERVGRSGCEQKMTEAASLMRLGRRQVFRLARAYAQRSPGALFPGKRGRPGNRVYPTDFMRCRWHRPGALPGLRPDTRRQRSLQSFMTSDAPVEACSSAGCTAAIVWAS